jgi:transcriptional regulator with XRE-family HTH domain
MSVGVSIDIEKSWGRLVKKHREDRDLTQDQLADLLEVSQGTISKIENGDIVARDSLKLRLADALGVRPQVLFPWPGQEES